MHGTMSLKFKLNYSELLSFIIKCNETESPNFLGSYETYRSYGTPQVIFYKYLDRLEFGSLVWVHQLLFGRHTGATWSNSVV